MSDETAGSHPSPKSRNIEIHLSDQATLRAVRVEGGFHILVGDDVEIRGVTPEHMRSLVGSVLDAYLPVDMASRILSGWPLRGRGRVDSTSRDRGHPDPAGDPAEKAP